jgi:hypothetical protein
LVVLAVWKKRSSRSTTNFLLVNLAISDVTFGSYIYRYNTANYSVYITYKIVRIFGIGCVCIYICIYLNTSEESFLKNTYISPILNGLLHPKEGHSTDGRNIGFLNSKKLCLLITRSEVKNLSGCYYVQRHSWGAKAKLKMRFKCLKPIFVCCFSRV